MISYRSIKRLLGETSLERKCRFLFGAGLLALISGSFAIYARMTRSLVDEQLETTSHNLVPLVFYTQHLVWELQHHDEEGTEQPATPSGSPQRKPAPFKSYLGLKENRLKLHNWFIGDPVSVEDRGVTDKLLASKEDTPSRTMPHKEDSQLVSYYELLHARTNCIQCHNSRGKPLHRIGELETKADAGDPVGIVRVTLRTEATNAALKRNNLLLLALAILTVFLAMLGAYAIVRYVIVKPVLHLKDVSDEIARGNLEHRADINTGDEFEQLSHAFNRMLRHMMTVNDELRTVNEDLDLKFDQLAQVNLRLYETSKMKDEFLATISHELRTPLNSIIGFSDVLLSGDTLEEKQRRYVTRIQGSGENLRALIDDLLDLAKIESGKMDVQAVEFRVEELIERQTANILPLAEKKNIELKWDVTPGIPALLQDFGKMTQVLNNLLSNAIKFTPEGGRVRVTAHQVDRGHVEILVEDTGIGIPLDEQERVFEKFRQASTPGGDHMTREYEGTGLGLSIVRELCHLLGGEVSLTSEFGKGSTFEVRLPVEVPMKLSEPVDFEGDTEVDAAAAVSGQRNPAANH